MNTETSFHPVLGPKPADENGGAAVRLARSVQNAVAGFVSQLRGTWFEVMDGLRRGEENGAADYEDQEQKRRLLLELAQFYIKKSFEEPAALPEPELPRISQPRTLTARRVARLVPYEPSADSLPPRSEPEPLVPGALGSGAWAAARTGYQADEESAQPAR